MLPNAVWAHGGGGRFPRQKSLRRHRVQFYWRYEGLGWCPISMKIELRNT